MPEAGGLPITERVLRRLPGPRLLWMLFWGAVFFLHVAVLVATRDIPARDPELSFGLVALYMVPVALWGIARITRELDRLRPTVTELAGEDAAWPFRGLGHVPGPLALAAIPTALYARTGSNIVLVLPLSALANFAVNLPIMTLVWAYGVVVLGLIRLGRSPLRLRPFAADRSLGLRPVGGIAFAALWIVLLGAFPLLPLTLLDPRTAWLVLSTVTVLVVLFFLSLYQLHRRMVEAKAGHMARARQTYAQAFAPAWTAGECVESGQALALLAAEALERRALAIQAWPFDEGIFARVAAIVTTVIAAILARFILEQFGL